MATRFSLKPLEVAGGPGVEITTSKARMRICSGFGPRIQFFGRPNGENLLFWDSVQKYKRGDWHLRGGHRVWTTRPGADESEETLHDDNARCDVEPLDDGVLVVGGTHPVFRLRKSIAVHVLDAETFVVENRVLNDSDMLWSGGVWALTCTLPRKGTTYGIPLGDGSDWDTYAIVIPRRWAGHESPPNDPQIRFTEDCMVLDPKGVELKRMVQAPLGLMGMNVPSEKLSFLKRTEYERGGSYPLNTNFAFYVGPKNFMVEMESMGPEAPVKPKREKVLEETWALRPSVLWEEMTPAKAKKLI
jgi:hypothetical protein